MDYKQLTRVAWHITNRCNNNCKYCFAYKTKKDLCFKEHMQILNNLIKSGVKEITWTGGECLMVPHLIKLMNHAKQKGISNIMVTNGVLLNEDKILELQGIVDQITISFNSLDPKINHAMGKNFGHEELVINRIKKVKEFKIPLRINTVVCNLNKDSIDDLGKAMADFKVEKWVLQEFSQLWGLQERDCKEFIIKSENFKEVVKSAVEKFSIYMDVSFRSQKYFENNFYSIESNGDLTITKNGKDTFLENLVK